MYSSIQTSFYVLASCDQASQWSSSLSSCIDTTDLLQVAHHNDLLNSEVNMTEEFGIISICIVSLQMVLGLVYSIVALIRKFMAMRGKLTINSEPIAMRGQLKTNATTSEVPTHTRQNSVYFGYVWVSLDCINQSINHSMSINQLINRLVTKLVTINQSTNQSTNQCINQSINQ